VRRGCSWVSCMGLESCNYHTPTARVGKAYYFQCSIGVLSVNLGFPHDGCFMGIGKRGGIPRERGPGQCRRGMSRVQYHETQSKLVLLDAITDGEMVGSCLWLAWASKGEEDPGGRKRCGIVCWGWELNQGPQTVWQCVQGWESDQGP
jgi:hypothetical protein